MRLLVEYADGRRDEIELPEHEPSTAIVVEASSRAFRVQLCQGAGPVEVSLLRDGQAPSIVATLTSVSPVALLP